MRPLAIEELDRDISDLCVRINAATYELLILIREFDQRGGYLKYGLHNTVCLLYTSDAADDLA